MSTGDVSAQRQHVSETLGDFYVKLHHVWTSVSENSHMSLVFTCRVLSWFPRGRSETVDLWQADWKSNGWVSIPDVRQVYWHFLHHKILPSEEKAWTPCLLEKSYSSHDGSQCPSCPWGGRYGFHMDLLRLRRSMTSQDWPLFIGLLDFPSSTNQASYWMQQDDLSLILEGNFVLSHYFL